jgi:YebC/PmpR family DNA-binding regulatory protein
MSGHSKWSTIRHQKAITDAKRGSVFTKIAKKIHVAVKNGGSSSPDTNPFLRTVLDEARLVNMPNDNIKRAIEKAMGVTGSDQSVEVVYEAYGPGGVALMVTCVTDNRNRTATDIKIVMDRHQTKLAGIGSVSYMLQMSPIPEVDLGVEDRRIFEMLLDKLDEMDDVVDIWSNMKTND